MNTPSNPSPRPSIPLNVLQKAISDGTRWKILELLLQRGPLTTELVTKGVQGSVANVSKHLVFLRQTGILEHRLNRLYAIPDAFIVPGERAVDFGPILLRFDQDK